MITGESSPLYMASSGTQAGKLWLPNPSPKPLSYTPLKPLIFVNIGLRKQKKNLTLKTETHTNDLVAYYQLLHLAHDYVIFCNKKSHFFIKEPS